MGGRFRFRGGIDRIEVKAGDHLIMLGLVKWFGEYICRIFFGWYVGDCEFVFSDEVTGEMVTDVDVL